MSSSTHTHTPGAVKAGHDSSVEPSPASTFGGSASSNAGDDVRTPDDGTYSPPFIRKSTQSKDDDPFTASPVSQRRSAQRTPTGPKSKGRSAKSDNWRSGSSSGSDTGTLSPSAAYILRGAQTSRGALDQDYMSDGLSTNESLIIKSEDAQAIFPPSSCVFVANLLQSEGDEALEVAVTQVFREYGTVYVKIRRDAKHMPFAFCQYTVSGDPFSFLFTQSLSFPPLSFWHFHLLTKHKNDEDAERAIKDGRGRLIKGRPCRCEKAKAHRLFFFERKYGSTVTPSEVENLLRGFGRIVFCRPASAPERANYNLNEGVMVQFEMYDEGQAALQTYRNHNEFKMQCMANMGSSRGREDPSDPALRSYLDVYDVDKRSVFVGNLPVNITEGDLKAIFQQFGEVLDVSLHKNESIVDASQKHCFAFVEFKHQPSVSRVLATMNGFVLRDRSLKITQKDTDGAKSRSRRQSYRTGSYQSPASRSVGMPQASPMSQISPVGYSPSNYAYQGGQFFNYPSAGFGGQQYAYSSPSPSYSQYPSYAPYYAYTGSPSYHGYPGASPAATGTGSPTHPQYYYGYPQPQYAAAAPGAWQTSSPLAPQAFYPTYSPPTVTDIVIPDDRSATPTPAGHGSAVESSFESE
ncbi:RNA recognition domain-containing protein [Diplocarpon rosae]|nr:RNA recognition domain-containing protein [Diplocarpon rosae]